MIRLPIAVLVALVVGTPLAILPAAPVSWFAVGAAATGSVGVLALSVSLVTASASLSLVAYALALSWAQPVADPVVSVIFGGALVLVLALTHFARRSEGAMLGPGVIAGLIRHWLAIVGLGIAAAAALTLGGVVLGPMVVGASLPVVVVAGALGAALTVAGVIALVTTPRTADGESRS
jgi:hypothetical protein